jgi:hypothetical protein
MTQEGGLPKRSGRIGEATTIVQIKSFQRVEEQGPGEGMELISRSHRTRIRNMLMLESLFL